MASWFHVYLCLLVSQGNTAVGQLLLICQSNCVHWAQAGLHLWCILITRFICVRNNELWPWFGSAASTLSLWNTTKPKRLVMDSSPGWENASSLFFLKYTNNIKPVPICYVPARSLLLFLPPFFSASHLSLLSLLKRLARCCRPLPPLPLAALPPSSLFCIFISC